MTCTSLCNIAQQRTSRSRWCSRRYAARQRCGAVAGSHEASITLLGGGLAVACAAGYCSLSNVVIKYRGVQQLKWLSNWPPIHGASITTTIVARVSDVSHLVVGLGKVTMKYCLLLALLSRDSLQGSVPNAVLPYYRYPNEETI